MKKIIITLILWAIAYFVTIYFLKDSHAIGMVSPVFGFCMIGSIMVVRSRNS